ncbi:MAG TPA: hypothetical protein VIU81_01745 [Gaiellaceae bacterium]
MTEVERALLTLGQELEFPAAPDLATAVGAQLRGRPRRARLLAVALGAVIVAFGIAMAVPQARSAILDFFHIGAATVERVDTLPAAQERPLATGLGPPLSRSDAELRAHLEILLPGFKSSPPGRYYAQPGLIATLLHYRGQPVLLAEMRNDQTGVAKKFVSPETRVEPVEIGLFGIWLEGGRHVLIWQFGVAAARSIETRLAGNVLLWTDGTTTYRLEAQLTRAQMVELGRDITR